MILSDTLTLDAPRRTKEGYLAVRAKAARAGVYEYYGYEIDPKGERFAAMDRVPVYRPAEEVFDERSVGSFLMKPITNDHPSQPVTADNWKELAKGVVAKAMRDGDDLNFDLVFMDAATIADVDSGKKGLSNGYTVRLDFGDGVAPDGKSYKATQRSISGNHIAVVKDGRAGPEYRIPDTAICDALPRNFLGDNKPMKTIVHDGISIEFADQAADAYNSLLAKLNSATATIATRDATIAERDRSLAKAEADRDAAQSKIMDAAALDAAVTRRADLIATAKQLHDADYTGKSELDIRKAVLTARGIALDGKSDAYIEARFDGLVEDAKAHGRVHQAIATQPGVITNFTQAHVVDAARKGADAMNDWRNKQ